MRVRGDLENKLKSTSQDMMAAEDRSKFAQQVFEEEEEVMLTLEKKLKETRNNHYKAQLVNIGLLYFKVYLILLVLYIQVHFFKSIKLPVTVRIGNRLNFCKFFLMRFTRQKLHLRKFTGSTKQNERGKDFVR